jgi:hypothetical protein
MLSGMNTPSLVLGLAVASLLGVVGATSAQEEPLPPERRMDVTQKPDTVFTEPVERYVPELRGATPTNENGRVGGELVFWGYRLGDGRPVYMFACTPLGGVNCEERIQLICETRTEVLRTGTMETGNVVRRSCRNVAFATPGDTRPGCNDNLDTMAPLTVGLVSCG